MNGGVIPHHRQAAYDQGYHDGRERERLVARGRFSNREPLIVGAGFVWGALMATLVHWIFR